MIDWIGYFKWKWNSFIHHDASQHGESLYLNSLIHENDPKAIVEVGAFDGKVWSNSYFFIKNNWNALLIEPLPAPYKKMTRRYQNNKNVICINKACSNSTGQQDLLLGNDDAKMCSTLSKEKNEWFEQKVSKNSITVDVDTLTNVLTENHYPEYFSILSIDAEGMDYEVLLGLDFNKFRPKIIMSENYDLNTEKQKKQTELLRENNYTLHGTIGSNNVWINQVV